MSAQADGSVYLTEAAGNLNVGSIFSGQGDVVLLATGSILRGTPAGINEGLFQDVAAARGIVLTSTAGSIGLAGNQLHIQGQYIANLGGTVTATATQSSIYLVQVYGDVTLGTITAAPTGSAFISAAFGSINNGNVPGVVNVMAGTVQLSAAQNIGSTFNPITTQTGTIEVVATAGDAYVDNHGALVIGSAPSAAAQGVVAGNNARITATGPITFEKGLTAAGSLTLIVPDSGTNADPAHPAQIGDSIVVGSTDINGQPLVLSAGGTLGLYAGADITVLAGATLTAGSSLIIQGDYQGNIRGYSNFAPNVDPGIGTHITLAGTLMGTFISVTGEADPDVITVTGQLLAGPMGQVYISGGDGDDRVTLSGTITAGATTIDGGAGDDTINVNADGHLLLTGSLDILGGAGDDAILIDKLPTLDLANKFIGAPGAGTLATGLEATVQRAEVFVDTGSGNDLVTVNTTGTTDSIVRVTSTRAIGTGSTRLVINGTGRGDTVLMRDQSVIVAHTDAQGIAASYERIDYDASISVLQINEPGGDNHFIVDGNSAITFIDAGSGNNTYQFGQLTGFERVPGISIASGETIPTIQTDLGAVSRGIRYATTVLPGAGNDSLTVYATAAPLTFIAGAGADSVVARAFVATMSGALTISDVLIEGGSGALHAEVSIGAPVTVTGGSGATSVALLGTAGNDTIVVTKDGVFSAGRTVRVSNATSITIDGLEGNDTFDVLSTAAGTVTTLIGGGGNDTFNVAGDAGLPVTARPSISPSGYLNYGVTSDDAAYAGLVIDGTTTVAPGTVVVTQPGAVVRGGANGTDTSSYTLRLAWPRPFGQATAVVTAAAENGILLSTDGLTFASTLQVTFLSTGDVGTPTDWTRTQTIYVRAPQDGTGGTQTLVISHALHSDQAGLDGALVANAVVTVSALGVTPPVVAARVLRAADVLIVPKTPSAALLASNYTASETIQLTKAPSAPVYVALLPDDRTFVFSDPDGLQPERFSVGVLNNPPTIRFDATNWNIPFTLAIGTSQGSNVSGLPIVVQPFQAATHTLSAIQGSLVIKGGAAASTDYALKPAVMLPSETDPNPALALDPVSYAANSTVTLNVFNDASTSNDVGTLGATDSSGLLKGLGLGTGGIVYTGVQVVDVLLGSGDDSFTVGGTTPGSVTVVQGGGGSNHLVATGGGGADAPLVLLGGTTQNGSFYAGSNAFNATVLKGSAKEFTNPGNNVIDARADANSVVIYGGVGDDTIYAGGGGDWIAGGSGNNTIFGGSGADVILGGGGFNLDLSRRQSATAQILSIASFGQGILDQVTGDQLTVGTNTITGGDGNDVIFATQGTVGQDANFNPLMTTGHISYLRTASLGYGNADVITAGKGDNIILGGYGADTITVGNGRNVIIGDGGNAQFTAGVLTMVQTLDPNLGGADVITAGNGANIILGGAGSDTIKAGDGANIVLGDNGQVLFDASGTLTQAVSLTPLAGANNVITTGKGDSVIIGGFGANTIKVGDGQNIVFGNDGSASFAAGVRGYLVTTDTSAGGDSGITLGGGANLVFGGSGNAVIEVGGGNNVIIGRNGWAEYSNGLLATLAALNPEISGSVSILAGNGHNVIIGGFGNDTIVVGDGGNVVAGDGATASFAAGTLVSLATTATSAQHGEQITTGTGDDFIIGGGYQNVIDGGSGTNVLIGHAGMLSFNQSVITEARSTDALFVGGDTITVGDGNDAIISGPGYNTITAGNGNHLIVADAGDATFKQGVPSSASSNERVYPGFENVTAGAGNNVVFRASYSDTVTTGAGSTVILNPSSTFDLTTSGPFWQAAAAPASPSQAAAAQPVSAATLVRVVAEAEQIWTDTLGANSAAVASFTNVHVALGTLPPGMLGLTDGDTIVIDALAAGTPIATAQEGHNFFRVEAHMLEHSERVRPGMEGVGKITIGDRQLLWIWTHGLVDWLRAWAWKWLP